MTIFSLVGQALTGWLVADALGGVFHYWQDRVLTEDTPILGSYLAAHAQLHHREPLAFTNNSFLYRNGPTYVGAAIVAVTTVALFGVSAFAVSLVAGIALSTQTHFWAHRPSLAPAIVRRLQETGFLQSTKEHSRHHAPPFKRAYCPLTNFLNPILELTRR